MTTGVPAYSTIPANNVNANTGINWDEGMSPGAVNNSARANMADLRTAFNDLIWFQYGSGTSPVVTPAYASGTSFTVAGIDVTAVYHAGRRVKAVGSGTGTIYGTVSSSAFSTNTTVNVTWDSGSLTNEALTIYLCQIPVTGVATGTGKVVLATSPTITTPTISGTLTPSSTSGIVGTTTNNDANAGSIGEFVESVVSVGVSYAAGSGNGQNVTSISLTAGDWDVQGLVIFGGAATSNSQAGINSTTATLPVAGYISTNSSAAANGSVACPRRRFSLSVTTTIYLVGVIFSPSSNSLLGFINARRVR